MEMRAIHLNEISCEVVLFNRQRFRLSNRTVQRIVYGFSGNILTIQTKKLINDHETSMFFNQIKSIYLDKKIVAIRGCPELPLRISNYHFAIMEKRQRLLKEAEQCYKTLEKEEFNQWYVAIRHFVRTQSKTAS